MIQKLIRALVMVTKTITEILTSSSTIDATIMGEIDGLSTSSASTPLIFIDQSPRRGFDMPKEELDQHQYPQNVICKGIFDIIEPQVMAKTARRTKTVTAKPYLTTKEITTTIISTSSA